MWSSTITKGKGRYDHVHAYERYKDYYSVHIHLVIMVIILTKVEVGGGSITQFLVLSIVLGLIMPYRINLLIDI